jgi:hypothetical protein
MSFSILEGDGDEVRRRKDLPRSLYPPPRPCPCDCSDPPRPLPDDPPLLGSDSCFALPHVSSAPGLVEKTHCPGGGSSQMNFISSVPFMNDFPFI